jgi:hypothetical protein
MGMDSTRALFASIGVSVSLVAAATLSLFAVSVVIAFGGWSAGLGGSDATTTLVFGPTAPLHAKQMRALQADREPVVLKAPAPSRPRNPVAPAGRVVAKPSDARAISNAAVSTAVPMAQSSPQPIVTSPTPPAHKTPTGDGVRQAGKDLSSVAHNTGKALSDVTAPLAPPVSAAVQKVLDLVAALLQRTTNTLGGTVDQLGQK